MKNAFVGAVLMQEAKNHYFNRDDEKHYFIIAYYT